MALDVAILPDLWAAVSDELQLFKSAAADRANEDFTRDFNRISETFCIKEHLQRIQDLPTRFLARDVFDQLLKRLGQRPDPDLRETDPRKYDVAVALACAANTDPHDFAVAVALACASSHELWGPPHLRDLHARIAEIHHLMVEVSAPPNRAMDFAIAYLHGWRRDPPPVWMWRSTTDPHGTVEEGWVTAPGWRGVPDGAQAIMAAEILFSVFSLLAWMAADRRALAEREHNNVQAAPEERVDGAGHVLHLGLEFSNTVADRFLEKDGHGCRCWAELSQGENENQEQGENENQKRRKQSCLKYHRLRSWDPTHKSFGPLGAYIQKAVKGFAGSPDTGSEGADGPV